MKYFKNLRKKNLAFFYLRMFNISGRILFTQIVCYIWSRYSEFSRLKEYSRIFGSKPLLIDRLRANSWPHICQPLFEVNVSILKIKGASCRKNLRNAGLLLCESVSQYLVSEDSPGVVIIVTVLVSPTTVTFKHIILEN